MRGVRGSTWGSSTWSLVGLGYLLERTGRGNAPGVSSRGSWLGPRKKLCCLEVLRVGVDRQGIVA